VENAKARDEVVRQGDDVPLFCLAYSATGLALSCNSARIDSMVPAGQHLHGRPLVRCCPQGKQSERCPFPGIANPVTRSSRFSMHFATYRGVLQGKTVLLRDDPAPLPDGTEVLVTPVGLSGTPAAVLAAVAAGPPVPREWVDELDRAIGERPRPSLREDPFAESPANREVE
jgi:hypothetical protein